MDNLIPLLEAEVGDPDEEVFLIYSEPIPSSNLGFISSSSSIITVSVGEDDYEIHQSPGLLSSNASSGTTGAVLWKITPLVAEWLSHKDNVLFNSGILSSQSHVIELGCGISGLLPMTVSKRVGKYIATDLNYVLRGLRKNLEENGALPEAEKLPKKSRTTVARHSKPQRLAKGKGSGGETGNVDVFDLDWTECTTLYLKDNLPDTDAIDCVLACDCIYNEALVDSFVQTCANLCSLRDRPAVCVIAQQLRSDLVFEAWLKSFIKHFHVYKVPDRLLLPKLRGGSGYVVHIGIMRREEI